MTREESIKILAILKAAYPNSYKGMTKDEANGTINIWAMQFNNISYEVVSIAINKLISTNTFPPTINEVKQRIRSLYWEAWGMLNSHNQAINPNMGFGQKLDDRTLAIVQKIVDETEKMRTQERIEPSLNDLLPGLNNYLESGNDKVMLNK